MTHFLVIGPGAVGAALAGSKEFIEAAWRWKHQFGGAMRQAGIIAAGAVYALNHHIERLAEDHENAKHLAKGLAEIDGIDVETPETNLLFFDIAGLGVAADEFDKLLQERGLVVSSLGDTRVRAVTHMDVSRAQIEDAVGIIRDVVNQIMR